jgi:signal transduction histidine kinase
MTPRRRQHARSVVVSARTRVLAWLLVVVGVAVLGSVLVSRQLLMADVDRQLNAELTHEASKFRAFAASDIDPETGARYTGVDQLLARYLERNLPEGGETFFSLVNGRPSRRSAGQPDARLDTDKAFLAHIRRATEPVSGTWDTAAGEAAYAALPVRLPDAGAAAKGTLVVVEFRQQLQHQADHLIQLLLIAAVASLALAGVVGWAVAGRVLAPVRAMRRTAEHITGSDLTERIEVSGNDDVAALARTFNTMLDRLQAAFTGQRQFLDDAGHELRTPITVIRGHLEVMGDDPVDREATVALVLDELDRMARIVDDLIVLAKAERPDFLTLGNVDLADLAVDVLAKAQALADRRWSLDGFADRVVRADGQRLTQALMQLADNAARHTGPGDVVAIGTAVRSADPGHASAAPGERVLAWVRDSGSGIGEADRDRIFDRFYRGADRHRTSEGAGLGLAIVARIAAAHHGHVDLDTTPGQGATFTLDLPLVPIGPQPAFDEPQTGGSGDPEPTLPVPTAGSRKAGES